MRASADQPALRELTCFGRFRGAALQAQLHSMGVDACGTRLLDGLAARHVRTAVVKDPAIARLHPSSWPRPYADIDVLVDPSNFDNAMALALGLGTSTPIVPSPNGHGSTGCAGKGSTCTRRKGGTSISTTTSPRGPSGLTCRQPW